MADAYVTGLRLLAGRELSESQLRTRLERREFDDVDVDAAVERLRQEGALDDLRTARACARTEAHVKRHGRLRVLRQMHALGISRGIAQQAVAEVFADVDEDELLVRALEKRLRGTAPLDNATARRVQRYLLAQGFEAARVNAVLRERIRHLRHGNQR